jgi:hypothetical protein
MRTRSSRRLSLSLLLGLLALALARPAAAQFGTAGTTGAAGTSGSVLAAGDIFIGVQQTEGSNLSNFDLARFFNKANCDCSTPVFLFYTLTSSGFAKRGLVANGTVSFWIGSGCDNIITQKTNCQFLGSDQIATFMQNGRETIKTTARAISANSTLAAQTADGGTTFSNGTVPNPDCTTPTPTGFDQTVYAVFDFGSDGTFDFSATSAVHVDLTAPPAPTNITVLPGNEAVTVTWTPVDFSTNMDLQGYQVFCQRADGFQVFASGTNGSAVRTCAVPIDSDGGVVNDGGTSSTTGFDPNGVTGLNELFACSPLLNRTADSFRVKILQNDIPYLATVVAIDNSGNALPPDLGACVPGVPPTGCYRSPEKTESFWDVYRGGDYRTAGKAEGGYCAVGEVDAGTGRGGWPLGLGVSAGALGVALAIARRRRRRR